MTAAEWGVSHAEEENIDSEECANFTRICDDPAVEDVFPLTCSGSKFATSITGTGDPQPVPSYHVPGCCCLPCRLHYL